MLLTRLTFSSLRLGLAFAVLGLSALTGTPIAGALLTDHFMWWRPIMFSGVS